MSFGTPFLHLKIDRRLTQSLPQIDFEVRREGGYYIIGGQKTPVWLKLRIRSDFPTTYCYKADDSRILCGYGPLEPSINEEFLQIIIMKDGTATIRRDAYATLPLWFGESQNVVSVSNSHYIVHNDLPQSHLDRRGVIHTLMPNPVQISTIWQEMQPLNERHILEINRDKSLIRSPFSRKWRFSAEAPSASLRDFSRQFSDHLDYFTATRLAGQRFAFEVSGGLDSSTLPLYHARLGYARGMGMGSLVFPGDFEATQRNKLDIIAQLTGLRRYEVLLEGTHNYPLTDMLHDNSPWPFYCLENIYAIPAQRLISQMARQGVRVIATGHGGDDVFENTISLQEALRFGDAERRRRHRLHYAPFFTERFRQEYLDVVPDQPPYPVPLLSASLLHGLMGLNNTYIEQDVWPVSPFIDPALHELCQGLPAHWRKRKAIMRIFYQVYGFPEEVFNPVQNEHFGAFFEAVMTSAFYDELVSGLAAHSIAAELGYIDPGILLRTYNECKQSSSADRDSYLLAIYTWLCFEINAAQ